MKFKKSISILLSLIMIMSIIMPISAFADDMPAISVQSVSGSAGDAVNVSVVVTNNPGVLGATLKVSYDSKNLTLTGATSGSAFSHMTMTKPGNYASPCNFVWDGQDLNHTDIKDGVILSLNFLIDKNAESDTECPISISYNNGDIVNGDLQPISFDVSNGYVSVINYMPGDLNGDKKVNSTDIIMLRRHIAGGYEQTVNELAGNVNGDNLTNSTDIITIRRYVADGCKTDPNGYNVKLLPAPPKEVVCEHELQSIDYTPPSCTVDGNIAYWYCKKCHKSFSDEAGINEIDEKDIIIEAPGHKTVVDAAVAPTYESEGLTEGSHCSVCHEILVGQKTVSKLQMTTHSITYDTFNGDSYLASKEIVNPNPSAYSEEEGLTLKNISVDGYRFLGWYDGAGNNAEQIKKIAIGATDDIELYAHWEKIPYTVQLKSDVFIDTNTLTYTVDTGVALPTPKLSNYIFTGWSDETGHLFNNTKIPVGTTGNIYLTANWTSERNKTWSKSKLDAPIIVENENDILFAYEIGQIQNVPLYTIKDFGYISGEGVTKTATETYSSSVDYNLMSAYAKSVTNATTDSSSWSLANSWNDVTSVNEQWAKENGKEIYEAETIAKNKSNNWNISSGRSGSTETSTITTNNKGWQNQVQIASGHEKETSDGTSHTETDNKAWNINGKLSYTPKSYSLGLGFEGVEASGSTSGGLGGEIGGGYEHKWGTTDETTHNETDKKYCSCELSGLVNASESSTNSTVENSAWNSSQSYGGSTSVSESKTNSVSLSEKISQAYGYGHEYAKGETYSSGQGHTSTQAYEDGYSSSVTYSMSTAEEKTSTWTTQTTKPGYHRWIVAGTAHVFGVVGYNIPTKSYYVYTYSVMDDETHEFEDYSYTTASYNDNENGVIPFEIPYEVAEYVSERTCCSEGLKVDLTSGTITEYNGTDTCVVIPEYFDTGSGDVIKITGFTSSAFSGNKNIEAVVLSDYITEIPDNAFNGCSSLIGLSGGKITSIGESAFSGCTSIKQGGVLSDVESLGDNAFKDVGAVIVNAANANVAKAAANSGAKEVVVCLEYLKDDSMKNITIVVPEETEYFELDGVQGAVYENVAIESDANSTVINRFCTKADECIPLKISSAEIAMNQVSAQATGFAAVFKAEETHIGLQGTIGLVSEHDNALLAKSIDLYEFNDKVVGNLSVTNKALLCSEIINSQLFVGNIEYIDSDKFDDYLSTHKISFDANGGDMITTEKMCVLNTPIGELPTATRDYYTFDGWYTEKEDGEGEKFTPETLMTSLTDISLYAHWIHNAPSAWVLASEAPENAEIVDRNYKYNLTSYTTSSSSSLSGWTKYDTQRTSWGTTQGPVYSNPSGSGRNVWSEPYVTSSNYKHWYVFYKYGYSQTDYSYSYSTGGRTYMPVKVDYWPSTTGQRPVDKSGSTYRWWSGNYWGAVYYEREYDEWISDNYGTRWYYQDPIYTYYYKKTENKESSTYPTGDNISDICEYVQYRAK